MTTTAQTGNRAPQLRPISPAEHRAADMDAGSSAAVRLREIPFAQILAIRAEPGSPMAAAVEAELGRLPAAVKQVTVSQQATTCWLSPDEFLAVLTDESLTAAAEVAETIMARAGSAPGHVLDVSANRTTLELSGPAARDILESSATIDLHPRMFPAGTAVATNFAQTQVILHKTGEETWRILPRSSFADSVVTWLLDAMEEYREAS
ncbi:sarcosine oxidase subunit gamma [Brevibacterium gallinarum]|uniref:Sarcosine oxidase subunit gamma n=1 Tax=Brevibacterium gallinarum TaxID=2762220 RepID=A0ABR8WTU0_9MICO|nr:sarcosine oxidase subunit gamma family protein [Brevibacterium gallinarum]MBD8020492.1 sarcosine oxidase subunit gamma [Brevibacterium gallinarum]